MHERSTLHQKPDVRLSRAYGTQDANSGIIAELSSVARAEQTQNKYFKVNFLCNKSYCWTRVSDKGKRKGEQ